MAVSGELGQIVAEVIDINSSTTAVAKNVLQINKFELSQGTTVPQTELQIVRFTPPSSGTLVVENTLQINRTFPGSTVVPKTVVQIARQTKSLLFESAIFIETLTRGSPPGAFAQGIVEALNRRVVAGQLSEQIVETISKQKPAAQASIVTVEALTRASSAAQITQEVVGVLRYPSTTKAAISIVVVEALRQRKPSKNFGWVVVN